MEQPGSLGHRFVQRGGEGRIRAPATVGRVRLDDECESTVARGSDATATAQVRRPRSPPGATAQSGAPRAGSASKPLSHPFDPAPVHAEVENAPSRGRPDMDDILGSRVSKLEVVPESEEARPADRVQIGFSRRFDTRTRHGGDGAFQLPKRSGRIAGEGKRLHPVDPPFPGPAARAIQKNAPDRPSSGSCVRRHGIAPPSGQALACASQGRRTGRDALWPFPFSYRSTPCRHAVRGSPYSSETGDPRRTRGDRPSPPSRREVSPAARTSRSGPSTKGHGPSSVSGRQAEAAAGADPGHVRPGIRGPLTLATAGPSRRCSAGPWQRPGKTPVYPCTGGPQYRNNLLILMTKPRLRRSHPRSGLSPPVTSR